MGEVRRGHRTGSRGRRRTSRVARLVATAGLFCSLLTVATTAAVTHTALASSTTDLAGPPLNSGQFGSKTYVLANGNLVVTDPLFDSGAIADVGAVYLYNGLTHQLISTLTGSTTMDRVGTLVTEVGGSNFVVVSRNWINAGSANSGATTWVNGTTGIPGGTAVVSTANSLVGSNLQDGSNMNVVLLKNGNYVVIDTTWDGPGAVNAGSYTWGSGSSGVTGTISASNSLVGSTLNDGSSATVVPLAQGNYVVATPFWDNGGTADVGAVTWASGTSGIHGPIAIGTALYGPVASASVGSNGTKALGNGNFVVASPLWDNVGTMANVGAVTWGNGATGTNGPVVAGNSVIGVAATDEVGSSVVA
ncbi:MAG: hypothetical protein JWN39_2594, partial [Ilumatobacteraceae bacterium]|nr:hypothetical protein [Ilumatobacteraceae bacterium]